jgi:cytochrome c oxidase subunit 2
VGQPATTFRPRVAEVKATRLLASFFLLLACAGCDTRGWQSALDPHSNDADRLAGLMRDFTIVCVVVWVLVMAVLLLTLFRSRMAVVAAIQPGAVSQKRATVIVSAAVGVTVIVITGLTLLSYVTTRALTADKPGALTVRLRGYQWWWEFTYLDGRPDDIITTANELHIPVGRRVRILLDAADVIHSFWVPSLAGKKDLIPGRDNEITIVADRSGTYRGQCAEYCGLQHAHMAFLVVADSPDAFAAWQDAQRKPAADPVGDEATAGLRLFLQKPCAACHTIRGTPASGTLGPDLTHVASRQFIAAGELPTTRGSLAAWIADPQTIKPGNNMPMVPLSGDELLDVSAYLASLR